MWINASYTDTTFLFSEKGFKRPDCDVLQLSKWESEGSHNSQNANFSLQFKMAKEGGACHMVGVPARFFFSTRRPPGRVVYPAPPLPTRPFRELNWDWLARSLGVGL